MSAVPAETDLYHELMAYTLAHRDPAFIHQHVVDAWAAQHADESAKPIGLVFALVGLYLHVEKGYTGRQVQRAHMQMGKHRKKWLKPPLPPCPASIGIRDVMATEAGLARDAMIHAWCGSVWAAWKNSRDYIVDLAKAELGIA